MVISYIILVNDCYDNYGNGDHDDFHAFCFLKNGW